MQIRADVLEIVKNYQMHALMMAQKKYEEILDTIIRSSAHVRFVGAIGSKGELLAYKRRSSLKPMMDANSTKYHFSQVALKNDMESFFDKSLGNVEFVWEEREKVQTIGFRLDLLLYAKSSPFEPMAPTNRTCALDLIIVSSISSYFFCAIINACIW